MHNIITLSGSALAAVAVLGAALTSGRPHRQLWLLPALGALLLGGWTLYAVFAGGFRAYWPLFLSSAWGYQMWFDLLIALALAFAALVTPMRTVGMRPLIWALAVIAGGSVGLLALAARLLYLQADRKP